MDDQTLHHFMQDFVPMVIGVGVIILIGWVIGVVVSALKQRAHLRTQTEFHNRLLEKFGSAAEFTAYLQSEAGQRFFEGLTTERITPTTKILGSVQKGAILSLLGIGLLIIGNIFSTPQGGDALIIFGVIALTLGVGFLVSAAISYRLSKAWGLITVANGKKPVRDDNDVVSGR